MAKAKKNAVTLATGAALSATLMAAGLAHAASSPFAMQSLEKGYMVADAGDKMKDGNCAGSAKGAMDKGADKMKDGNCANSDKTKAKAKADTKMKDGNCAGSAKGAMDKGADKMKDGNCAGTTKK